MEREEISGRSSLSVSFKALFGSLSQIGKSFRKSRQQKPSFDVLKSFVYAPDFIP